MYDELTPEQIEILEESHQSDLEQAQKDLDEVILEMAEDDEEVWEIPF